jgi:hypothetical protein
MCSKSEWLCGGGASSDWSWRGCGSSNSELDMQRGEGAWAGRSEALCSMSVVHDAT